MTNHGRMAMTLKPKLNHPNGKRLATIEEIPEKPKQELLAMSKIMFEKCFEYWEKRCIKPEGGYFERNKIRLINKKILFEKI